MTAVEELKRVIKEREEELRSLKQALLALESRPHSPETMRYKGMKPIQAMRLLLPERGGEMAEDEMINELVAGGILIGKKRGVSNVRVSLKANAKTGAVVIKKGMVRLGQGPAVDDDSVAD